MTTRGLTILCIAPATGNSTGAVVDYAPWVEQLHITSASPGGFGALRARLRLPAPRARLPRPE
ncbi:MAG: hypothetical protein H0U76_04200, partial [Ktedonobacteraceae bacterium]|nr:hypothetical protein [Ktedonobacteraceae bacterium]